MLIHWMRRKGFIKSISFLDMSAYTDVSWFHHSFNFLRIIVHTSLAFSIRPEDDQNEISIISLVVCCKQHLEECFSLLFFFTLHFLRVRQNYRIFDSESTYYFLLLEDLKAFQIFKNLLNKSILSKKVEGENVGVMFCVLVLSMVVLHLRIIKGDIFLLNSSKFCLFLKYSCKTSFIQVTLFNVLLQGFSSISTFIFKHP